jgi:Flp pilus assembly protein TadD
MKGKRKRRRDRGEEATHSLFEDDARGAAEAHDVSAEHGVAEAELHELATVEVELEGEPALDVVWEPERIGESDAVVAEPERADPVAAELVAAEPADEEPDVVEPGVAVEPPPIVVEIDTPPPDRLARARDLVARGKADEAIAVYRDILLDEPGNLKAYNNLGLLYEAMGRFDRALEQFEIARAIDPDNVAVISNVGGALIGLGRFDEAERELRRAMKLELENVDVRTNLGILFFRRGQYVQAENELRWVCERVPDHAPAHLYRGEALNRLNKVDKAIEVLERAAVLQPGNAKIYHTMGILFDKKNMPAEASRMYRKVRELSR